MLLNSGQLHCQSSGLPNKAFPAAGGRLPLGRRAGNNLISRDGREKRRWSACAMAPRDSLGEEEVDRQEQIRPDT